MTMNIPDASRTVNSAVEAERPRTHLEQLLIGSQNNEKRLLTIAMFACDILTKIR